MNGQLPGHEMLYKVAEMFHVTTGLVVQATFPPEAKESHEPDAVMRITQDGGAAEWTFAADILKTLTRATLGIAIQRVNRFQGKGVLITRYVTPPLADELRRANVQFLDMAGNAYLNAHPLFIFIKGNRPVELHVAEPVKRAFRPAGLQVLFALLSNPGLENATFREIAGIANVALGTVGWVMGDLKEKGYLVDMGKKGRHLVHKDKLLERWVAAYPDQLRPKLVVGRFRTADHLWWEKVNIGEFQACWGGEIAAALLTKYLKPQCATIYVMAPPAKLILQNKMQKDPKGNIEILQTFWGLDRQTAHQDDLAPPLLIYADLLATGDPRNIETAKLIYDQTITRLIGEN